LIAAKISVHSVSEPDGKPNRRDSIAATTHIKPAQGTTRRYQTTSGARLVVRTMLRLLAIERLAHRQA